MILEPRIAHTETAMRAVWSPKGNGMLYKEKMLVIADLFFCFSSDSGPQKGYLGLLMRGGALHQKIITASLPAGHEAYHFITSF